MDFQQWQPVKRDSPSELYSDGHELVRVELPEQQQYPRYELDGGGNYAGGNYASGNYNGGNYANENYPRQ